MVTDKNLHTGHRERVRRRVQSEGLRDLEPHEVIEFLLCYALPRQDVNATAHRLIETFGNVAGVLNAPVEDLIKVSGVGERTADILRQIGRTVEICRRTDIEDRTSMRELGAALSELRSFEGCVQKTSSYLMCLDMDGRLLYRREIAPSYLWGEPETLRKAVDDILSARARCAIIILYGTHAFDDYDIACARKLSFILRECGALLLDVLILSDHDHHSMRAEGLMREAENSAETAAICNNYLRNTVRRDVNEPV